MELDLYCTDEWDEKKDTNCTGRGDTWRQNNQIILLWGVNEEQESQKREDGVVPSFCLFFFVPLRFLRNAECGTVRRRLGELRIGDGARRVAGEGDGQGVARAAGHFLDGVQVLSARSEHGHAPCSDSDIQTRSNETNTHTRATVENCREPEIPPVLPFSALPLAVVYLSTKEQNRVFLGLDRT